MRVIHLKSLSLEKKRYTSLDSFNRNHSAVKTTTLNIDYFFPIIDDPIIDKST